MGNVIAAILAILVVKTLMRATARAASATTYSFLALIFAILMLAAFAYSCLGG